MSFFGHERSREIARRSTIDHDDQERRRAENPPNKLDGEHDRHRLYESYTTASQQRHSTRYSRLGNPLPTQSDKVWCTHWLRTRQCSFGSNCKYIHEAPPDDPEVLHALGFASLSECKPHSSDSRAASGRFDNGFRRDEPTKVASELANQTDDRGNPPAPTIWVGNIPPKLKKDEAIQIFGRYGSIISVRILQGRCMFVNYETVDSAIRAWQACHEMDVFNRDDKVFVRYQSNDEKTAMVGRPSIDQDFSKSSIQESQRSVGNTEWPNGKPPKGPKSLLTELSPPRSRRQLESDCYRPPVLRRDSEKYGASQRRADESDIDRRRPSYSGTDATRAIQPSPSSEAKELSLRSIAAPNAPEINAQRKMSSSVIKVEQEHEDPFHILAQTPSLPISSDGGITIKGASQSHIAPTSPMIPAEGQQLAASRYPPGSYPQATEGAKATKIKMSGFSRLAALWDPKYGEAEQNQIVPRTLLPPERVRTSNTPLSDLTSSSATSSLNRNNCYSCKKPGGNLSTLTSCSTCVRKYHDLCGTPRPHDTKDKSKFVCGHCVRKKAREEQKAAHPLQASNECPEVSSGKTTNVGVSVEDARIHADTTESTDNAGPPDPSPSNELAAELDYISEPKRPTNPANTEQFVNDEKSLPVQPSDRPRSRGDGEKYSITILTDNVLPRPSAKHTEMDIDENANLARAYGRPNLLPTHLKENPSVLAAAIATAEKYKATVTCPWYSTGPGCVRLLEDCMYAHRRTGIIAPSGNCRDTAWTCPSWRGGYCQNAADRCQYAHTDTGYYIGPDMKAEKKHLTCHWFYRTGRCKKADDVCPFAHHWTGLVAEEPMRRQDGSNFREAYVRSSLRGPSNPPAVGISTSGEGITAERVSICSPARITASDSEYEPPSPGRVAHSPMVIDAPDDEPLRNHSAHQENVTADPRLSNGPLAASSSETSQSSKTASDQIAATQAQETAKLPSSSATQTTKNPDKAMSSTAWTRKKCRACSKMILSQEDFCAICKNDASTMDEPEREKSEIDDKGSPSQRDTQTDSAKELPDNLDSLIDQEFANVPIATNNSSEPPKALKRAASGSHMFISSKRVRPNSTAPAPVVAAPIAKITGSKLVSGQPSIEQLIAMERAKKHSQLGLGDVEFATTDAELMSIPRSPPVASLLLQSPVAAASAGTSSKVAQLSDLATQNMMSKAVEAANADYDNFKLPGNCNPRGVSQANVHHASELMRKPQEDRQQGIEQFRATTTNKSTDRVCRMISSAASPLPTETRRDANVSKAGVGESTQEARRTSATSSSASSLESTDASRNRAESMTSEEDVPLAKLRRKHSEPDGGKSWSSSTTASRPVARTLGTNPAQTSLTIGEDTTAFEYEREDKSRTADPDARIKPLQKACVCITKRRKCLHDAKGELDAEKCNIWISERIAANSFNHGRGEKEMREIEDVARAGKSRSCYSSIYGLRKVAPTDRWYYMGHCERKQNDGDADVTSEVDDDNAAEELDPLVFSSVHRTRILKMANRSLRYPVLFRVQQGTSVQFEISPNWDRLPEGKALEVNIRYREDNVHPRQLDDLFISYVVLRRSDSADASFFKLWQQVEHSDEIRRKRGEVESNHGRLKRVTVKCRFESDEDLLFNGATLEDEIIHQAERGEAKGEEEMALSQDGDATDGVSGPRDKDLDELTLGQGIFQSASKPLNNQPQPRNGDASVQEDKAVAEVPARKHRQYPPSLFYPRPESLLSFPWASVGVEGMTSEREEEDNVRSLIGGLKNLPAKPGLRLKLNVAPEQTDNGGAPSAKPANQAAYSQPENAYRSGRSPRKRNREPSPQPSAEASTVAPPTQMRGKQRRNKQARSAEFVALVAQMKADGYVFEPSDNEDSDETHGPNTTQSCYADPLLAYKNTQDRFSYYYKAGPFRSPTRPMRPQLLGQNITKGQGLKNPVLVKRRAMLRNLQLFGNAHKACDRPIQHQEVTALVARSVPNASERDCFAVESIDTKEEKITFQEFCGFRKEDRFEPCLMGHGKNAQLAFRKKEDVPEFGKKRRVKNDERWPVNAV